MSEQQKDASQSLLTGVEQLVDQILFVTDIARQLASLLFSQTNLYRAMNT
jgi:hypothetical protein